MRQANRNQTPPWHPSTQDNFSSIYTRHGKTAGLRNTRPALSRLTYSILNKDKHFDDLEEEEQVSDHHCHENKLVKMRPQHGKSFTKKCGIMRQANPNKSSLFPWHPSKEASSIYTKNRRTTQDAAGAYGSLYSLQSSTGATAPS